MLIVFPAPPVFRLVVTNEFEPAITRRFRAEFNRITLLIGAEGVPPRPLTDSVPFVTLMLPTPPPLTIVLAVNVPPLTLIVPAEPAVTPPLTSAKVSVLFTCKVADVLSVEFVLRLSHMISEPRSGESA